MDCIRFIAGLVQDEFDIITIIYSAFKLFNGYGYTLFFKDKMHSNLIKI